MIDGERRAIPPLAHDFPPTLRQLLAGLPQFCLQKDILRLISNR